MSQARQLFIAGSDAADTSRWADALEAFREAYRLSGIGAALYNFAKTLRAIGEYRKARDAFDQLLSDHPELDVAAREDAETLRDEVAARVASLSIEGIPPRDDGPTLRLNGSRLDDPGGRPLHLELDPGNYSLRVELERYRPFVWEGRLGDSQHLTVEVALERLPDVTTRSPARHPALWVSVAVVLIGAAVLLAWFLAPEGLAPESDNVINL